MNMLMNGLQMDTNYTLTQNGGVTHKSTLDKLYDLYAMGGAYRHRSTEDVLNLFGEAYKQDKVYTLKCLFYLRNVRGGQGERRFFRECIRYLADIDPDAVRRNIENIAYFGRWDDLYALYNTSCWYDAMRLMKNQLALDIQSKTPSLLAKWMKSENASSKETAKLADATREYLRMSHRQYRKTLSALRERIKIVETLMSQNRWDEIEFDKLPSQAGLRYKNAFAHNDVTKARYAEFAKSKTTKVNAGALAPYEVVEKAIELTRGGWGWNHSYDVEETERAMVNKYWDNLTDYFNGANLNALCMVDTSGSMMGNPMNVAISLGLYCAERANGPFANHYISFASRPQLIACEGYDFVEKVQNIYGTNLCDNTNIEGAFDMVLNTAVSYNVPQHDMPEHIIVISDMEFDTAVGCHAYDYRTHTYKSKSGINAANAETVMEGIARKWATYGYTMPKLVFWNVNSLQNNIPMDANTSNVSFVSGFSPVIFKSLLTGKTGYDLMMEVLDDEMYARVK